MISVEKFEIVDLMGMKRRVWVTHLPAEIVNLKKYKEMGLKVFKLIFKTQLIFDIKDHLCDA